MSTHVARFHTGDGPIVWRKVQPSIRLWQQERRALLDWSHHLVPRTPRLLAWRKARDANELWLSHVAGTPLLERLADHPAPSGDRLHRLLREVGAFLRNLHSLPVLSSDPMPLHEALPLRGRSLLRRLSPLDVLARELLRLAAATPDPAYLSSSTASLADQSIVSLADQLAALTRIVADVPTAKGVVRVPCHRDMQARNWLIDGEHLLAGVVDFEHARPDDFLVDFVRVTDELPHVEFDSDALHFLLTGYGRPLAASEQERLRWHRALHMLQTAQWSATQADEEFARRALLLVAESTYHFASSRKGC